MEFRVYLESLAGKIKWDFGGLGCRVWGLPRKPSYPRTWVALTQSSRTLGECGL